MILDPTKYSQEVRLMLWSLIQASPNSYLMVGDYIGQFQILYKKASFCNFGKT